MYNCPVWKRLIGFGWALTRPLQNLNFALFEPFGGGLAVVFQIIVLLHNPSALELEVTN